MKKKLNWYLKKKWPNKVALPVWPGLNIRWAVRPSWTRRAAAVLGDRQGTIPKFVPSLVGPLSSAAPPSNSIDSNKNYFGIGNEVKFGGSKAIVSNSDTEDENVTDPRR